MIPGYQFQNIFDLNSKLFRWCRECLEVNILILKFLYLNPSRTQRILGQLGSKMLIKAKVPRSYYLSYLQKSIELVHPSEYSNKSLMKHMNYEHLLRCPTIPSQRLNRDYWLELHLLRNHRRVYETQLFAPVTFYLLLQWVLG